MKQILPFVCPKSWSDAESWKHALQQAMPTEHIVLFDELNQEDYLNCDVAIVANPDPKDLDKLTHLKWINSVWAGVEHIVANHPKFPIVRLIDPELSHTMAEAVLAWTLYLHRDMPYYAAQQKNHQWQPQTYIPAYEKTIAILGLGELGTASAQLLSAHGFRVSGWSHTLKTVPNVCCYTGDDGLQHMLADADIVISLLPLTPATTGLINDTIFAAFKPNSSLINFSRGAIVHDLALRHALDSRHLKHAVLDVFQLEPLPADAWHWSHQHVTVLPHISAPTNPSTASKIVAQNIQAYRQNQVIPESVDLQKGY